MGMIYKVHHTFKIKVRNYFEEQNHTQHKMDK